MRESRPFCYVLGSHKTHAEFPLCRTRATLSSKNGESDALHFIFRFQTGLKQSTHYVEPTRNSLKKMTRVTPCILGQISCCVLASVFVFADFLCLCFCRPAFASAFVSYIEAARGRVRGERFSKHFSDSASF